MLHYDLVDLRLFLNVLDAGSVTAGSARSHLAPASASARIKAMEERAGLPLFERHRGGMRPTKAGHAVAHHARAVLQQMDRLEGELLAHGRGLAGTVRLVANTAALTELLPERLAPFLTAHPDIDVDLDERPSHTTVARLVEGAAELGILADSVDLGELQVRDIGDDRLVAIVPRDHVLAGLPRRRVGWARLLDHPMVSLDDDSALQQHLALQAARIGRRIASRVRLRSVDGVCRLVAAGVGVAVVPAAGARLASRRLPLVSLALDEAWAQRRLVLCAVDFDRLAAPAARLAKALVGVPSQGATLPRSKT